MAAGFIATAKHQQNTNTAPPNSAWAIRSFGLELTARLFGVINPLQEEIRSATFPSLGFQRREKTLGALRNYKERMRKLASN